MTNQTRLAAFLGLFAVLGGLWLLSNRSPRGQASWEAPFRELQYFDRESVRGKHVLLHFWAKWCEPCAEEIPHLLRFARNARFQKPLVILAVSLDPTREDAWSLISPDGQALPDGFLFALDPEHRFAEAMGSYQYPETYLIQPDGKILEKWVGAQPWEKPEVLQFFRQIGL